MVPVLEESRMRGQGDLRKQGLEVIYVLIQNSKMVLFTFMCGATHSLPRKERCDQNGTVLR